MTHLDCYRLTFHGGLHLATRDVDLEESGATVPSDTLFAALVDAGVRAGVDPDDLVAPFPRRTLDGAEAGSAPPFRLTSTFPFAGDVRFFPAPVPRQRSFTPATLKARRKAIKGVRFVSGGVLRAFLAGAPLDDRLFPKEGEPSPAAGAILSLQGGAFWLTADEVDGLPAAMRRVARRRLGALTEQRVFAAQRVPRVTVQRIDQASDIFHMGRVRFAPGCGLWFGVDWCAPEAAVGALSAREAVGRALALLADDGLGGERSAGYGAFTLAGGAPLDLPAPAAGRPCLLLSRYHPRDAEAGAALDGPAAAYDLAPVGGWLRSWDGAAQRRKRLWMVEAGSVVYAAAPPQGDLVDVRPTYENPAGDLPHPVWRYGLALGIAMHAGHEEVHDA
jgi:CRISPR-associated protein Csm4